MDIESWNLFSALYKAVRIRQNRSVDLAHPEPYDPVISGVETDSGLLTLITQRKSTGTYLSVFRGNDLLVDGVAPVGEVLGTFNTGTEEEIRHLIQELRVPNPNGAESEDLLTNERPVMPLDMFVSMAVRAASQARFILAGIEEPFIENTPETQAAIAMALAAALKEPAAIDPSPKRQVERMRRAFAWAMRPSTQYEWGFFVVTQAIRNADDALRDAVLATDEFKAAAERYRTHVFV